MCNWALGIFMLQASSPHSQTLDHGPLTWASASMHHTGEGAGSSKLEDCSPRGEQIELTIP
jgi:hypothetical protein